MNQLSEQITEVVQWMGENIFPQKVNIGVEKFGDDILLICIREKIIQQSKGKIGMNPTTMKEISGYMELTESGWELFNKINKQ